LASITGKAGLGAGPSSGNSAGSLSAWVITSAALALLGIAVSLRGDLANYLALAPIACGDSEAAAQYRASTPQAGGSMEVAIERNLIAGVLALARGDRTGMVAMVDAAIE